ncbi:MAG TPA: septum formation initiator family protein [Acidimicrobiia bacterium]|nr:septum formation initiator family protein [Acidimicrobiia bacterium]
MREGRRGFGVGSVLVVTVIVGVVAASAGVFPFRQIIAQQRSVDLAEAQLDALITENRKLEQEIAALESPQEVERLAREHFGLVMPGDVAYVAIVPEGSVPGEPHPEPDFEESVPWWRALLNFLTGKDLVDG